MRKTFTTAPSSPPCNPWGSALRCVRPWLAGCAGLLLLLIVACSAPPPAVPTDPTTEAWYTETLQELESLNAEAKAHFAAGRSTEAAEQIQQAVPLSKRLLEVPRPNLPAMEAASDLDQLYGDMLQSNRHFAYAREFYQRNAARWRNWRPQTDETRRRLKEASDAMSHCDQQLDAER